MTELLTLAIANIQNKRIVVLGAGLTGLSCVRFLHKHNIVCSVIDSRENAINRAEFEQEFSGVDLTLGHWDESIISSAEILLVSPGIDTSAIEIKRAINQNCIVAGDVELFCQNNSSPILAITGSNGKSTVVSMLAFIGKSLGYDVELGGNIGVPVLERSAEQLDCLVLELSSFQLETLTSMNAVGATVLNVSDDHLDRHKTLANYAAIKQRIYQQCKTAVVNRDDKLTLTEQTPYISFGHDEPEIGHFGLAEHESAHQGTETYLMFGQQKLIAVNALPLAGLHNALNSLAVLALGHSIGWSIEEMLNQLVKFKGLAHRCQLVANINNVQWINDSKATNVGATLAAIEGLSQVMPAANKLYLIAGGDGKGADFSPLKQAITNNVSHVFTLGKDGDEIKALSENCPSVNSVSVSSIEEAINAANKLVKPGDVVLLSPACASIDMFKNFMERGQVFINAVQLLQEAS
jgi:UDP-N-acetylmuramoylalanine--D-glutamate ligase